ncbi:MAG TPA: hypothetical protein VMH39_08685, partial [Gemmatimonadaceae bacterium]|nr:hypothetical protein [Gemmatimonadaceae bacterium]
VVALTAGAANAQTGQSAQQAAPPAAKAPAAKQSVAPPAKSPPATGAAKQTGAPQSKGAPAKGPPTPATARAQAAKDSANKTIIIMREVYASSSDGRRDPFVSLLTTSELRPTMSDLTLNSIFYDALGGSVANVHDASSNKTYGIRVNQQLGRMHVVAIRPSVVVFSINEFGMDRRDSLFVRPDTSHMRFE